MQKIIYSIILLLFAFASNAQTIDTSRSAHSLGFAAGTTTGVGPCYRYMPKQLGAQITCDITNMGITKGTYGIGLTFFQRLTKHELLNLFCYQSFLTRSNSYSLDSQEKRKGIINEGFGFGLELSDMYGFSLTAMIGNANYGYFTKGTNHLYNRYYSNLSPTIEVALYYTFK